MRPLRHLSRSAVLPLLFLTSLSSTAWAQFDGEIPPTWRGGAATEVSGWDAFTSPFMGPNTPDLPLTTSDDAVLTQTVPGAIITSTNNIYHPTQAAMFSISDSVPADLIEVVLQTRNFGLPMDTLSPKLVYTNMSGQAILVDFDAYTSLASGAFFEDRYSWNLCQIPETILSYQVVFNASDINVSLDAVLLDSRFDGDGDGSLGSQYCFSIATSTGQNAKIAATGSGAVADNLFTLEASDMPLNEFVFFLAGTEQGFVSMPGMSMGNLCLGGKIARFNAPATQVGNTGSTGSFQLAIDLGSIPANPTQAIQPGETWQFQAWFRDGTSANFTDAVSVLFH